MRSVGLKALAVTYPSLLRTSDYFRERYPDLVRSAGDKVLSRVWNLKAQGEAPDDPWANAMAPYLEDPFRGTQQRRWLAPGESARSLELKVARQALDAAKLAAADVQCLLAASFLPDQFGVGNAAFLARDLGTPGMAFNVESACSSPLVGLQTAVGLVASGQYDHVLLVGSCTYSRVVAETDSLGWAVGDGAFAFVVGEVPRGEGFLSFDAIHTGSTCESMFYAPWAGEDGQIGLRMGAGRTSSTAMREAAERAMADCVPAAVKRAGASLSEIAFFATTTPVAWYSEFAGRVLGFGPEKTFNGHPLYANCGPALMPGNLFHGAHAGKIKKGDLVVLQTVGSVSSAGAAVLRWGEVALGAFPEPPVANARP